MHFYYGVGEKPVLVNFNGTMYTYVYSLQGDVVAILDAGGNVVVEYKYDAWGNIIASTGNLVSTLGYLNPFRYRGYVYDEETGLYYLRSRYYKAAWGRFINADDRISHINRPAVHNLFYYCGNNTIIFIDRSGEKELLFYYYMEDFQANSEANINMLMDAYEVYGFMVTSQEQVIGNWNDEMVSIIGDRSVNIIYAAHGNEFYCTFLDLDTLSFDFTIDTFVLLSCNCGNQRTNEENFAERLWKKCKGGISNLIAYDGILFFYYDGVIQGRRDAYSSYDEYAKNCLGFLEYSNNSPSNNPIQLKGGYMSVLDRGNRLTMLAFDVAVRLPVNRACECPCRSFCVAT